MSSAKRYHKLQEFPAHATGVSCLKIGRKSAGVLVTGGEDKKVNVWAIGKSTAILTLQGHQSPVDCVAFDVSEEVVLAGATNGTIKMWDLDQAKVTRTLTGHRSNCLCVDFHPYGQCLASGSLDTNIKIWDTRRRMCLSTLKGHTKGVTHVKFSPDGKWVVSGSENGEVKLWNIEAGKLFTDFKKHDNAITALDFHPKEYILASASADKTVRLWDIDTLDTIDILGGECHGVRTAMFHPEGQHLLTALQDGLRVWSWEPALQLDNVPVDWARIADISIVHDNTRLVGCSHNANMVGVWYIDLNLVNPWNAAAQDGTTNMPGGNGMYQMPQVIAEEPPPVTLPSTIPTASQIPGVMNPLTRALSPADGMMKRGLSLMGAGAADASGPAVLPSSIISRHNSTDRHGRISDHNGPAELQRKSAGLNHHARISDNGIVPQESSSHTPTKPEPLRSRDNVKPTIPARMGMEQSPMVVKRRTGSNHAEYTPASAAADLPIASEAKIASHQPNSATLQHTSSRPTSSLSHRPPSATSHLSDDSESSAPSDVPGHHPAAHAHSTRRATSLTQPSGPVLATAARGMQRSTSTGATASAAAQPRHRSTSFPQVEIHVPAGPPPSEVVHAVEPAAAPAYVVDDPFAAPITAIRPRHTHSHSSRHMSPLRDARQEAAAMAGLPSSITAAAAYTAAPAAPPPVLHPAAPMPHLHPALAPLPTAAPLPSTSAALPMEDQTLQLMRSGKDALLPQWTARLSNMTLIKTFLTRNNISGALSALRRHADAHLVAVILEVLADNKAAITLDSIADYVPLLETLLSSHEEHHCKVGLKMLSSILAGYGQYIRDTIAHGNGGMRTDLTGEQRRDKCMTLRTKLSSLLPKLGLVPRAQPDISRQAEDLMMQLEQL